MKNISMSNISMKNISMRNISIRNTRSKSMMSMSTRTKRWESLKILLKMTIMIMKKILRSKRRNRLLPSRKDFAWKRKLKLRMTRLIVSRQKRKRQLLRPKESGSNKRPRSRGREFTLRKKPRESDWIKKPKRRLIV